MANISHLPLRPKITIGEPDYRTLMALAMAGVGRAAEAADDLLAELERAKVRPLSQLPSDVVRMGSTVRYRTESDQVRDVTLVYPAEADISTGAISVLTPVGTALIGLLVGQSISWTARDGRQHALTVLDVGGDMPPDDGPVAA